MFGAVIPGWADWKDVEKELNRRKKSRVTRRLL